MGKPVIGVMPQYSEKDARLMIVPDFFRAVDEAGGIPVLLPLFSAVKDVEQILDRFDGFLYPGGPDINPLIFGEETRPECGSILPERDALELGLLPAILRSGKPVFGICRGIQVMNVALGGTLYQDLSERKGILAAFVQDEKTEYSVFAENTDFTEKTVFANEQIKPECGRMEIGHYQKAGDMVLTHSVSVEKGTLLYDIVGKRRLFVNSFHHQACKKLGDGMVLNAAAPDGVVEAAALENHRFFLGVQWHPEHLYREENMAKLWNAFVGSC